MPHTKNQTLLQIVPRILPGQCGVSDHALTLADELQRSFQIETVFIALNQQNPLGGAISCKASQLEELCNIYRERGAVSILVHLSGYGYAASGIPAELAKAFASIQSSRRFRSAVYFHELFARGWPWQKAFWYSRGQRLAVRQIAESCDLALTNIELNARWLHSEPKLRCEGVSIHPVFSTIGETATPLPFAQRSQSLIVFGLSGSRQKAYRHLLQMEQTLHHLQIKKILDIGPGFVPPENLHGIPVHRLGQIPSQQVAEHIAHARFGFVPHEPRCIAKSSIFAAYCAYGTIPLLMEPFSTRIDQLQDGLNVISMKSASLMDTAAVIRCGQKAFEWYSGHNLYSQAAFYAQWMRHDQKNCPEKDLSLALN
ncbi:hypothetical protein ACOBR2_04550 [Telmatobacter bradus]|uniref:hypothetical protein n=1 Tax=Telmatobacter bradus TaxID=474953 RepID=UPI003B4332FB